jgi:hypothetical protein
MLAIGQRVVHSLKRFYAWVFDLRTNDSFNYRLCALYWLTFFTSWGHVGTALMLALGVLWVILGTARWRNWNWVLHLCEILDRRTQRVLILDWRSAVSVHLAFVTDTGKFKVNLDHPRSNTQYLCDDGKVRLLNDRSHVFIAYWWPLDQDERAAHCLMNDLPDLDLLKDMDHLERMEYIHDWASKH